MRTYEAIAAELGYVSRGTAFAIIQKALQAHEALQASLWSRAMAGDVAATAQVRRIIEARIRLLGLLLERVPQDDGGCRTVVYTCPPGTGHRQQLLLRQE
jgi:hypothetical protein